MSAALKLAAQLDAAAVSARALRTPNAVVPPTTLELAAQQLRQVPELLRALRELSRAYVSSMESGRERIIALGGTCDSVDVMERGDPHLAKARGVIALVQP